MDPYAFLTVRAFLKYTREQLEYENTMQASLTTHDSDAKNFTRYMRTSPATHSLFRLFPSVGGVCTIGGQCLLVNGKSCAEPVVLGQQEVEVCQCHIPSSDHLATDRFTVINILESKMSVTSAMRYAPQMESEVLKKLQAQGHTTAKVDIMMIATQGWLTRHSAIVVSNIIEETGRLWRGNMMIVHRTDNDVHQKREGKETPGELMRQFISDFLEPMTTRWGIHQYCMLPHIQDTHVDQVVTLAGGSKFPRAFAAQFGVEMAKHRAAVAMLPVSQDDEPPPSQCPQQPLLDQMNLRLICNDVLENSNFPVVNAANRSTTHGSHMTWNQKKPTARLLSSSPTPQSL